MQSEMACHIGLRGKFFCRICTVKGRDADDERETDRSHNRGRASSSGSSSASSDNAMSTTRKRTRARETIENLVDRARRFMQVSYQIVIYASTLTLFGIQISTHRDPRDTRHALHQIYEKSRHVGTQQERKRIKTSHGVKDTFLDSFIAKIDKAVKGKRGVDASKAAEEAWRNLPVNPFSSVWRIRGTFTPYQWPLMTFVVTSGLNPHADTPVEILHVVLLGVIKYFWRDAVARLSDSQKSILRVRLASLDVTGLDPSLTKVAASTLVNYAGSLVGRDFRVIIQVAPFVLYGLLHERIYLAWLALGQVARLCWQPEIDNLDQYLVSCLKLAVNFTHSKLSRAI